jgi:hypothetical protein
MNLAAPGGNDPLGLGVQARAAQERQKQAIDSMNTEDINSKMIGGPLPDPAWEGFLQAMNEHNVGKVVGANVPGSQQMSGMPVGPMSTIPQASGERSELARQQLLPGYGAPNNVVPTGAPPVNRSAISGLQAAGPSAPDEVPGQWDISSTDIRDPHRRGTTRMPVMNQRGGDALNSGSQRYRVPNPNE